MGIQQIIEKLLRSRLYRTGVEIEMDSGETHWGLVKDLQYAGSRSLVVVTEDGGCKELLLAHIVRVAPRPGGPSPKRDAA